MVYLFFFSKEALRCKIGKLMEKSKLFLFTELFEFYHHVLIKFNKSYVLTLYALNYFSKVIESNNFHTSNRHDFWPVTKRPQQRMLQNYTRRKQNMYPTCHVRF